MIDFNIDQYRSELRETLINANKANKLLSGRDLSVTRFIEITMQKMDRIIESGVLCNGDAAALGLASKDVMKKTFVEINFDGVSE